MNKRIKLTKNFYLDEFLPRSIYEAAGFSWASKQAMIDERVVLGCQLLRDRFGALVVNNWYTGGERSWSGLRTPDSPYYNRLSQHTWGRGADPVPLELPAEEIREDIKHNYKHYRQYITRIEDFDGMGWVHIDCAYTGIDELVIFGK